jgi:glycosyltransferase involved in cell wall biosynthesis
MKIAVVEPAGRGGMIHYAFQLCRALQGEGLEVTLLTDRSYELDDLEAPFEVVKLLRLWDSKPVEAAPAAWQRALRRLRRPLRALRYAREHGRLVAELRRRRPDWVQLGDVRFAGDFLWLDALRRAGLRLTDTCHNLERFAPGGRRAGRFHQSRSEKRLYRRIYSCFHRVWVHFDCNRARFLELFGLPGERVGTIPHGNEALFDELRDGACDATRLRRRLALGDDEQVVLFFGTLTRYKGVELLVEAFQRVLSTHRSARLVLAGYPGADFSLEALERRIWELGIAGAVRLHPLYVPSAEVAAWMELAAVAVFPYRQIFQSGALHVAHTFGVPIVASDVGAMGEVVRHGETGLLVPPGDATALAAAVAELLERPEAAARMGQRARVEAYGSFAWERVAGILAADYRRLAALEGIA